MTASSSVAALPIDASTDARLRAVGEPGRVQRDRALLDAGALARHEVAAGVEDASRRSRRWRGCTAPGSPSRVVVEQARHERADDEVRPLEGLVHRRRLVQPAGDRLEVVDGERVRVEAAVPADHVERVVGVGVAGPRPCRGAARAPRRPRRRPSSGSAGPRRSRSQYGACSRNWPRATGSAAAGRCGRTPRRPAAAAARRRSGTQPVRGRGRDDDVVAGADRRARRRRSRPRRAPLST